MADITDAEQTLNAYRDTLDAIKQLEERKEYLKTMLVALLGDDDEATIDGRTVFTYRETTSMRIDTKRLKATMPDIAAKFSMPVTSVALRLAKDESVEQ